MATGSRVTFLFSLPRSGTQWLCWLYGSSVTALHDPLKTCGSVDELHERVTRIPGRAFIADTSALLFHDAIQEAFPGNQSLYLWRDPRHVMESINRAQGVYNETVIRAMEDRLFSLMADAVTHPSRAVLCGTYDRLHDFARHAWPRVTGGPGAPEDFDTRTRFKVDTPLPDQYDAIDYPKVRRLFTTREIAR